MPSLNSMQWRRLLLPFSVPYYVITWLRNKGFDKGILKSSGFDVPTLVLGNLSTGGTGKTPHTEWILKQGLVEHVVVLSRGYGRKTKGFRWVETGSTSDEVGDEPLQVKRKFPSIPFAVCEDRVMAIPLIMAEHPETQLIVLDDAFQHRYLQATVQVLLTTQSSPFSRDSLLPAGNLREPKTGSERADVLVVTKCADNLGESEMEDLRKELGSTGQEVYFSSYKTGDPKELNGKKLDRELLRSSHAFVFSAIAGGAQWANSYTDRFKTISGSLTYRDHHRFSRHDIKLLLSKLKPGDMVLTTEKDAMRLEAFKTELADVSVVYFPLELDFFGKEEEFASTLKRLLQV